MKVLAFLVLVLVFLAETCYIHQADLKLVPNCLSLPHRFWIIDVHQQTQMFHILNDAGSPISILQKRQAFIVPISCNPDTLTHQLQQNPARLSTQAIRSLTNKELYPFFPSLSAFSCLTAQARTIMQINYYTGLVKMSIFVLFLISFQRVQLLTNKQNLSY